MFHPFLLSSNKLLRTRHILLIRATQYIMQVQKLLIAIIVEQIYECFYAEWDMNKRPVNEEWDVIACFSVLMFGVNLVFGGSLRGSLYWFVFKILSGLCALV